MSVPLDVTVGGVDLRSPVILASGCAGYGAEWNGLVDWDAVGAVALKGVSRNPWPGNEPHRVAEAPAGLINAIGLENVGLDVFRAEKLPALADFAPRVVVNVIGRSREEYREVVEALDEEPRVDAVELNVSCPNVTGGGMAFGANAEGLRSLVRDCRDATAKPLWVKLAPLVSDVVPCARAALAGGADALTVANTVPAMAIDVEARRPVLGNVYGGLSGPAIRPAAVYRVFQVARAVDLPVIGMGGIWNASDALEFILAGASAVAIGTALYADPAVGHRVLAGLRDYLERHRLATITDLIGSLELH